MPLTDKINLARGLRIAKRDVRSTNFVKFRIEPTLIEYDRDAWLAALGETVDSGGFLPQSATIIEKPKGEGHIRPGVHLEIEDQIVYAACVASEAAKIAAATRASDR